VGLTICISLQAHGRFGETYRFHLQSRRMWHLVSVLPTSTTSLCQLINLLRTKIFPYVLLVLSEHPYRHKWRSYCPSRSSLLACMRPGFLCSVRSVCSLFMLASWRPYSSTLKMEAIHSSETSVDFYRTVKCYIILSNQRHVTISFDKFYTSDFFCFHFF
jgi:hypothetical protein